MLFVILEILKVHPYHYEFQSYAKGRWIGRTIFDVFSAEFYVDSFNFENLDISANGIQVSGQYIIRDNDYICHKINRFEPDVLSISISILYCDKDLIIVDKPYSIPVSHIVKIGTSIWKIQL